ncbi:hypothetical protein [Sorangium sp. So ce1000]|uniref:hypothetical protein n=1 Tax=Sorangium sp. So ce1000 TaxID=3133325 RepID=UPI003F5F2F31
MRMGQGFREGKLVNDIYRSFDEVDDFAMNSWSSEHLWETSPADGILGLFVRPPPSDDRVWGRDAYTEASLAGLADFAEELGWTSDSLVTQDYLSRSWGGFTMGGEVSITEEGAAARAEDEALNDPSRSRYVSTVYATAYVMTGLRLSFDSEAQCKHDALLRLFARPGARAGEGRGARAGGAHGARWRAARQRRRGAARARQGRS